MKWGPRSANGSPARFVFAHAGRKRRLRPALALGNVEKMMSAPVTAIIAYDLLFFEKLPKLFAHAAGIGFESFSTPVFAALVPTVHSSALQPMEADLVSS